MDIKYIIVFMLTGIAALLVFNGFEALLPDMSAWQMILWGIVLIVTAHTYMTKGPNAFMSWQFWAMIGAIYIASVVV